jgi:outer membrane receptor protein involved in Fe transport
MNIPKNYLAGFPLPGLRPGLALLAAAAGASFASAQAVAPASRLDDRPPADGEPLQLSPFEIRTDRDVGYYSRETLQGGRTSTDLKDTPAGVTILNQQFIEDIAATNLLEAEIWAVNTEPTYNPGLSPTGSNHRGPNFSFFSRNYFLWYNNSDAFSTERFEFGRGPNGVLFGDGNIGGLASTMTKQAFLGRKGIAANARISSWGGYRATADISVPVGDRMAFRLNLLHDRGTRWQDNSDQNRDGAHLTGTIKLFQDTTFRFEGEIGEIDRQRYNVNYAEQSSYWDGTTSYNGTTPPSTTVGGPGVARVNSGANYFVDIPGDPGIGYLNWATFYRSTGSGFAMRDHVREDLPMTVAMPLLTRRELNILPRDARFLLKYATSTLYLEHRFTDDLFAQIAYNSTRTPYKSTGTDQSLNQHYIDINAVLPSGAPNPNFGKPYAENVLQKTQQMNNVNEVRGFVAYRFDTGWWKSNLNALGGSRFDKFDYWQRRLVQTNGTNPRLTAPENEYHLRVYWDNPIDIGDGPNIAGREFDYARYTNLIHQRKFIDYGQLVSVNKFFDERLTAIVGGRLDRVHQTQRSRISDDPVTGLPILGATYIPPGETRARAVPGGKSLIDRTSRNYNWGLVYHVLPWVGAYYNYSQTFATPDAGNNLIDGSEPPISHSKSHEYGVKFNLLDGKVYADVRYYDSEQTDMLTTTGSATQINNIWTQLGRTDLNGLAYRDTQSLVLDGYEFEVTANPTRNLRLIANYALPQDHRNVNALPGLRSYYEQHVAEWRAAAETNSTIRTNLETIETLLKNNETFAVVNRFTKYRGNIYATYTFRNGRFNGVAVGAGANVVGPQKVGSAATPFDYLWADSYYLVSAHVSFSTKILEKPVKWQINVKNLFNEDDPVATSFGGYREKGVSSNPIHYIPNAYRYNDPREIILSATVKF